MAEYTQRAANDKTAKVNLKHVKQSRNKPLRHRRLFESASCIPDKGGAINSLLVARGGAN